MARPNAGEDALWQVLEQVNLADFLRNEKGLDTVLNEKASNLSGGQCQRLALARALLMTAPFTSSMKPPPILMWRAKMISCVRFTHWQKPKP